VSLAASDGESAHDLTEEEFLRRVTDPDLIDVRAQRRALRRAQQAGLTEEQRRIHEDMKWANTTWKLRQREWSLRKIDELADARSKTPSFAEANEERRATVDQKAAHAREAYALGVSKQVIAKRAKRSTKTVDRWLKRDSP
jgi:hypothetical protein